MEPDMFIKERVDHQIAWYDRKSATNKRWFHILMVIELVLAATLPFLSGLNKSGSKATNVTIGIIGIAIVIINGLLSHFKLKIIGINIGLQRNI